MQILRFHPLKATDGLLKMVNLTSTGCRYCLRLRHYWSLYYVAVLQTAQPFTADTKENGVLCAELCQCGEKCDNPHNCVWKETPEDSEGEKECSIVRKAHF